MGSARFFCKGLDSVFGHAAWSISNATQKQSQEIHQHMRMPVSQQVFVEPETWILHSVLVSQNITL